ncbi:MAG: 50S ribosomal protein L11 methyltransferase [Bacteroidales bacterium]|nr:50S ribosomal protein L11 methyltransferase [Bacteroidales bacterium]
MKYIEVTFTLDDTGLFRDMLVSNLAEGPYESFVETADGVKAYVPEDQYDRHFLDVTVETFPLPLKFTVAEMEDRDWNAEWEKGHEAVLVKADNGTTIWVRAPFHPHRNDVDYELIIEPKMSFGTAHHPTTYMMLSYVAELDMVGRRVLDMGCGTAVLGILAKMRGADYVMGIDVDEWAFRNAQENAESNGVPLDLRLGDAGLLGSVAGGTPALQSFDIIIANINRNILLRDMEAYAGVLKGGGVLLLSGFYEADEGALIARANELGMVLKGKKNREGWSAIQLRVMS